MMGSCKAPLFARNCVARLFDFTVFWYFSRKLCPEPPNPGLPSEYHPRTLMTGLEVSTCTKPYISSTKKARSGNCLGPWAQGPWQFPDLAFWLIVCRILHVLKPQGPSSQSQDGTRILDFEVLDTTLRKTFEKLNIKKTRGVILCKARCLTAPHHFSQPHW